MISIFSRMCAHDDGDYATLKKPENNELDDITEVDKVMYTAKF